MHAVRHSSNRNPFSNWLSCFGESSEILSMTYVVLKGYLYDPIDCIRPAVAIERGKYTEKTVLFNFDYLYISSFLFLDIYFYILVLVSSTILLVSDPGSVSSFFRDELSAPVLHFFSVDRGERGLSRKRIVP
uniref:Uncharacterized protein n=1 Tax=Oryza sativa TaxID=4530 RepID=A0A7L7YVQ2_ORYSA|nr:hypothetical protein [Oryza sativa]QOD40709.1 hypothetical protein [Oryza sativa]